MYHGVLQNTLQQTHLDPLTRIRLATLYTILRRLLQATMTYKPSLSSHVRGFCCLSVCATPMADVFPPLQGSDLDIVTMAGNRY